MTTRRVSSVSMAALIIAGCSTDAPAPFAPATELSNAASCRTVSGTITAQAVPIIDPVHGLIGFSEFGGTVTGDLAGSAGATLYITKLGDDGTIHFTGTHTFETGAGLTLVTSDRGVVSSEGRVNNSLGIVGGGSGKLNTHGTVNADLLVELRYHGRVCT